MDNGQETVNTQGQRSICRKIVVYVVYSSI